MSVNSMTGYGRGEAASDWGKVVVEISSTNRKHFDFRFDCDKTFAYLEPMVLKLVKKKISRGALTCRAKCFIAHGTSGGFRLIDEKCAARYAAELKALAARLGLNDDIGAGTIAALPGVIRQEYGSFPSRKVWSVFSKALNKALDGVAEMRASEGKQLAEDLRGRLLLLSRWADKIEKRSTPAIKNQAKLLVKRIADLGVVLPRDDDKLAREIAFLADRADVSEEITRLRSHIKQFVFCLDSKKPAGKTMEFLAQELLREGNTMGSKSLDRRISSIVIKCKSEIERIREQVLNVE